MQSIILLVGGLVSVVAVISRVPGGVGAVAAEAQRHHKLSLGSTEWSWEERTVPTVLTYAAVHYMTKFITFQDAVQRYLAVPSHKVHSTLPLPVSNSDDMSRSCANRSYNSVPITGS